MNIKAYAAGEYPYAQTLEGLYYRQQSSGVDVNVVFPFTMDLYCDQQQLLAGTITRADNPVSPVPYQAENLTVMQEIFDYNPQLQERFIPFVSVDTGRDIDGQIAVLEKLNAAFPIYGIKINPAISQSNIKGLLDQGSVFLDFAAQLDIPFLFHCTPEKEEQYSYVGDAFEVIETRDDLRFCLAHACVFHKAFLDRAAAAPNVWVDTAALKIQVEFLRDHYPDLYPRDQRIDADFSDHTKVMQVLMGQYADTVIWGSDAPAYTYICKRKKSETEFTEFNLSGTYEDEKAALDSLPEELRLKASNANSLKFLFGES